MMSYMFHDKFFFLRQILMTVPLHRVSMVEFVPTNLMIIDVTVVLDGVARTVISVRYFCSSGLVSAHYQATVYHSSCSYQCLKTDSLVSHPLASVFQPVEPEILAKLRTPRASFA